MAEYNASDTRQIRKALKSQKALEEQNDGVVANVMSSPAGREWIYQLFVQCHIFASSFSPTALGMAFAEGERNIGLQLLNTVMRAAPDQYVHMMREQNDRTQSDYRRGGNSANGNGSDRQPDSAAGSGDAGVESDYEPFGEPESSQSN